MKVKNKQTLKCSQRSDYLHISTMKLFIYHSRMKLLKKTCIFKK